MPVQRTHQASDIEKRLKILKSQLYGKNSYQSSAINLQPTPERSSVSDLTFLKKDLLKIAVLGALAIGVQFILYISQLPDKIKLF